VGRDGSLKRASTRDARRGSRADIPRGLRDVRYSPESGHGSAHAISQLLSVVFLCDGRSAISDGVGVFRIELEHLVEVLNSPIVLTLVYVGATAIVEGIAVVRIKLDRQVEVLNGAVNSKTTPHT